MTWHPYLEIYAAIGCVVYIILWTHDKPLNSANRFHNFILTLLGWPYLLFVFLKALFIPWHRHR